MKVSEIERGTISTIELCPAFEPDFGEAIPSGAEVYLTFAGTASDVLAKVGQAAYAVMGADAKERAALSQVMDRGLPMLAWAVAASPNRGATKRLVVQLHEFAAAHQWPDTVDFSVDEKLVDEIRRKHRTLLSIDQVLSWLNEQVIVSDPDRQARVLVSAGSGPQNSQQGAFRLHGKGIVVDVKRAANETLRVTRVAPGRHGHDDDHLRPVLLIEGAFRFVDASVASSFQGDARTRLDELVEKAGSYLNIWKQYNDIESSNIVRVAREFGWLRYNKNQALPDGRWRFHLSNESRTADGLQYLHDNSRIELQAAAEPPPELIGGSDDGLGTGGDRRFSRLFAGTYGSSDRTNQTLELWPVDDDDEVSPPAEGVLFLRTTGDAVRLQRREKARDNIVSASCPMPQLGLLLEGQSVPARRPHRIAVSKIRKIAQSVFNGNATTRQMQALQVALQTPDIALIQGPPGTGKTQTIVALQRCLAELSEDRDGITGQTLLTSYQHDAVEHAASRTTIFGLPAIKVGRKRGQEQALDGFEAWRHERIHAIRGDLASLPSNPTSYILSQVRSMAAGYLQAPRPNEPTAALLAEIDDLTRDLLPAVLKERLLHLRQQMRNSSPNPLSSNDDRDLVLRSVRAIRAEPVSFADDGPANARKALIRLRRSNLLTPEIESLLALASEWEPDGSFDFLNELGTLRDSLIDMMTPDRRPPGSPVINTDVEDVLGRVIDALYDRVQRSSAGPEAILRDYLNDLENDPDGLRNATRNYSPVLAATCQQAVAKEMSVQKGLSATLTQFDPESQIVFENVIIDEAARANPLDLAIPMSLAQRRIILVGDHRQLPHILEPDVERELEKSVLPATREALERSLFERLFKSLRDGEKTDGIKRTVTLNVQYRMHPVLGQFVSDTFYKPYGEEFESGRSASDFCHDLSGYEGKVGIWMDMPLRQGPEISGRSKRRPSEARWIAKEIHRLMIQRPDFSFGVISFYADQVQEILRAMELIGLVERTETRAHVVAAQWRDTTGLNGEHKERLRVGTVDSFQGKEFDVVILSMTRSNSLPFGDDKALRRKYGHLMLENRLCVAMSRQQRLLIVAGDSGMIRPTEAVDAVPALVSFHGTFGAQNG